MLNRELEAVLFATGKLYLSFLSSTFEIYYQLIVTIEAAKVYFTVFIGNEAFLCVPEIINQMFEPFVSRLFGHIVTEKTAVVEVFAPGSHIALRGSDLFLIIAPKMSVTVYYVPIDYLFNRGMREPKRIKMLYNIRLKLLVLFFPRVRRNRNLCDLQGLSEI